MKHKEVCPLHKDMEDKIDAQALLIAESRTDIRWIREHISEATENKKWMIGTIMALIALLVSIIK